MIRRALDLTWLAALLLAAAACDTGGKIGGSGKGDLGPRADDVQVPVDQGVPDVPEPDVTAPDEGELPPDSGPTCESACEDGAKECAGGGARTCSDIDDDGCYEWGDPVPCDPGNKCQAGECVPACPNVECTALGAHKCQDEETIVECGDFDSDGCLEWGNPITCDGALVCSNGFCATSCSSACTVIGAKKCDGNAIVTCGDYNSDGCLEWGDATDCGDLVCSGGFCKQSCENECTEPGAKKCDGTAGFKTCGDYNGDSCLEWGTVVNCGLGTTCSNGFCKESCESECTVVGAKKCDLNAVTKCGDYNSDGCLEWGTPTPCGEGLACNGGNCEQKCKDECTVVGAKDCDLSGGVVTCGSWDGDGCLEWGTPAPCQAPYVCSEGNCSLVCSDQCTAKNEKKCVPGATKTFQVCDDYNDDGCLEWGTAQECPGTQVCSGGNCAVSCESACAVEDETKCDGNGFKTCGDYNDDGCLEWGTVVYCAAWEKCQSGKCAASGPPAKLVISEVLYDSKGADENTFVELHGPAGTPLAGFFLVGVNGYDGADYQKVALAGEMGADGLFLVGHPKASAWISDEADQTAAEVDYQNGPDSIQLRYGSEVVDALGYGTFDAGLTFAGEGKPAPKVEAGQSLARDTAYTDTGDNAADFAAHSSPTPGAKNEKKNELPTAKLVCPTGGKVGEELVFDAGGSSDPDGPIAEYLFDFGDGGTYEGSVSTAKHTYSKAGTYTVKVTVTDQAGDTDDAGCTLTIGDEAVPEVVIVKPTSPKGVTQGEAVPVIADATPAPGRSIAKVELLADGKLFGGADVSAPYELTYTVPASAKTGTSIALQAKATDDKGSAGFSKVVQLDVKNDPPVAIFTAVVSGVLTVALDASASWDAETPKENLELRWDFTNDGTWDKSWSKEKVLEQKYMAEGKYTIRMEVRDADGQSTAATQDVTLSLLQYVSGTVNTTTWTGTIVVTGDVTVPAGQTLTVGPGTSVLFTPIDQDKNGSGDYGILANGKLLVQGTKEKPVLFSVFGTEGKKPKAWDGIVVGGADSLVQHAIAEYAVTAFVLKAGGLSSTVVRQSETGVQVTSGSATVTMDGVTITENTKNGLEVATGTANVTGSTLQKNGGDGAWVSGGKLNLSDSQVTANARTGLSFSSDGGGSITHNTVEGNDLEGLRIATDGSKDPAPVVNYNNIYGNAVKKARVVVPVNVSAYASGSKGKVVSSAWSTPAGEIIDWLRVQYSESDSYGYVSGAVLKDSASGTEIQSWSSSFNGWIGTTTTGAKTVVAMANDGYSSYTGTMLISLAAFDKAGAATQASIITKFGTVDLRHNYFGAFPKVLDVVALGSSTAANIQGFVGAKYGDTWSKGPYWGGASLDADATWSGDVYVTGDVTVPSGKTLKVAPGAKVQFANVDQNGDGHGDYGVFVSGTLDLAGTSTSPILFTVHGAAKAPGGYTVVKVDGSGAVSSLLHATIESGYAGLHLRAGTHTVNNVTSRGHAVDGILIENASNVTGDQIVVEKNTRDGIRYLSCSNVTLNHVTAKENGGYGLHVQSSKTSMSVKSSTLTKNQVGVWLKDSTMDIDHCDISYNGIGAKYQGSSGQLSASNIKFNDREGIVLTTAGTSLTPAPVINGNNIFSNSLVGGSQMVANPVSAAATGSKGKVTSNPWGPPGGQSIHTFRASYSESDSYGYVSGALYEDSASGTALWETSQSAKTIAETNAKKIVAMANDGYSSYTGTMTVTSAFFYEADLKKELLATTESGKVDCKTNYWGIFPDPTPRFTLIRSDAIDFQGFIGNEHAGTGPK